MSNNDTLYQEYIFNNEQIYFNNDNIDNINNLNQLINHSSNIHSEYYQFYNSSNGFNNIISTTITTETIDSVQSNKINFNNSEIIDNNQFFHYFFEDLENITHNSTKYSSPNENDNKIDNNGDLDNCYNVKLENNYEEINNWNNFTSNPSNSIISNNNININNSIEFYGSNDSAAPFYFSNGESESESESENEEYLEAGFVDSDELSIINLEFEEEEIEEEVETIESNDNSDGEIDLFNFNIGGRFQNHLLIGQENNQVYISKEFEDSIKEAAQKVFNISLQMSKFTNRYIKIIQGAQNKRNKIDSNILRKWLEEHIDHPYPTKQEKILLANQIGCSIERLNTWFTNNRRRSNPKCILHKDNKEIIKKNGLDQLKKSRKLPSVPKVPKVKKSNPPRQLQATKLSSKCKESNSVNLGLVNNSCQSL